MVHVQNYETVSKFDKVMPRMPWPLFSGHGVVYGNIRYRPMRIFFVDPTVL